MTGDILGAEMKENGGTWHGSDFYIKVLAEKPTGWRRECETRLFSLVLFTLSLSCCIVICGIGLCSKYTGASFSEKRKVNLL
jgi:hypothetical protein